MLAAQIHEYGGPDKIKVIDVPIPHPTNDQILIEVRAASLNPFDTAVREGHVKTMIPSLPITLAGDISGVVREVGADVSGIEVGDEVYGQASVVAGNSGALAELAITKATQIAQKPNNLDFQQAAAMPLVGVSALQAITEHILLGAGQKIFIHGGAGGIGAVAIQIAKNIGAYVATTATGDDIDYVKSIGADEVVDYKSEDFSAKLNDFDAVFDTVGRDDFIKSFLILKPGGIAVSMIAPVDEEKARTLKITAMTQSTKVTSEKLNALRELVEKSVVSVRIGKAFKLADVQEAFKARESASVPGKIVVTLND